MSREELTQAVMALPLAERVSLAQDLWQSIDGGLAATELAEDYQLIVAEASRRAEELDSGKIPARSHDQVMEQLRRAIECS